jgi:hypothetical protein
MSTKNSIFLTNDNEHCYTDCNQPHFKNGKFIGDTITLEMDKKNIKIICNTKEDLIIEVNPGSELYELIKLMKN